jgi:hypothetical protein
MRIITMMVDTIAMNKVDHLREVVILVTGEEVRQMRDGDALLMHLYLPVLVENEIRGR